MTSGGSYLVVGVGWLVVAMAFYWGGTLVGRASERANDGCLLGATNILLTLIGGGMGLLVARHPVSVATSILGAILIPGLVTLWVHSRLRKGVSS